jgi:hypothetical protein
LGTPSQLRSLAGQEHGRTIPLADILDRQLRAQAVVSDSAQRQRSVFWPRTTIPGAIWGGPRARNMTVLIARLVANSDSSTIVSYKGPF